MEEYYYRMRKGKSMQIVKEIIQNNFKTVTFMRGYQYYVQQRVSSFWYNDRQRAINAYVEGTYTYEVVIDVDHPYTHNECSCQAFADNGECKHVVAVLLELSDRRLSIGDRGMDRYESANQLLQTFSSILSSEEQKKSEQQLVLQTEFLFSFNPYNDQLEVEMKVGLKRTYVVKKMNEFLNHVEEGLSYKFGKNFIYSPQEHVFSPEDQEMVHILQEIVKNNDLYKMMYYQSYTRTPESRELVIPPFYAEKILELIEKNGYPVTVNQITFEPLRIARYELPISFLLSKQEQDFALDFREFQKAYYFEWYGWLFYEDQLIVLSKDQQLLIRELMDFTERMRQEQVIIPKQQVEGFLTDVFPVLEKLGDVHIDEDIKENIVQYPLKPKMWIDQTDEQVVVHVEFHYGDTIIPPFAEQEKTEGPILLRDGEKEREIMNLIEQSPLKFNGHTLFLDSEEDMYEFFYHVIPQLEKNVDIYTTEHINHWMDEESVSMKTEVALSSEHDWLEVSFELEGIEETHIQEILASIQEKKKYYRLPSGVFVSLENESMQQVGRLMEEVGVKPSDFDERWHIPMYRAHQVEQALGEVANLRYSRDFREFLYALKNSEQLDFLYPKTLQADLRDYQKEGFQWLKMLGYYRLGGILADDMGLGKTLQSISYLLSEKEEGYLTNPALVVCPASLIYNWYEEFKKFAPSLRVHVIFGTPSERKQMMENAKEADVWITSYPTLRQDEEMYQSYEFSNLVLDEAQVIKNSRSKTAKAIYTVKAARRFALSGTPVENALDELWSIFRAILPGFFPDLSTFRQLDHEKIARMIRPFLLRRLKQDVLKELPEKIETIYYSELTKEQKKIYMAYLEKIQGETKASLQAQGFQKSRMQILAGLTRLRQLCCHPSLFVENFEGESGKLEQLMELSKQAIENGKRLLIFSQFTSMLQVIRETLEKENISYFYLDGQTKSRERVEMATRFNAGEKEIFLISLKAGGTGLNLTGADTVILYDLWWNPASEEQAAGRAHRMGQKNVVQVIRLIASGTIEEKIYELQQSKKALIEKVIAPGEEMITSLTEKEMLELLDLTL